MLLRGSQHLLPNPGHLCAYSVSRALDSAAFMKVHVTGSYQGSHGRLVLREMVEQHGLPDAPHQHSYALQAASPCNSA